MAEERWAAELKKIKHTKKAETAVSLTIRMKQVRDKMAHLSYQLHEAAQAGKKEECESLYDRLVELRAKQYVQNLEKLQDQFGFIPELDREYELEAYQRDCIKLAHATDILLEQHAV